MLPGFRFLFAAIVLSMSILVFGLGAAALLRAAHESFASNSSWRAAPETAFAEPPETTLPMLATLRVEPVTEKPAAPAIVAAHPEPAPAIAEPAKADQVSAAQPAKAPVEAANSDKAPADMPANKPVDMPTVQNPPAPDVAPAAPVAAEPAAPAPETKTAAIGASDAASSASEPTPVPPASPPPATSPTTVTPAAPPAPAASAAPAVSAAPATTAETSEAETKIATLGGPPVEISDDGAALPARAVKLPRARPDESLIEKRQQARRALHRRRLAARARLLAQQQLQANPFAQQTFAQPQQTYAQPAAATRRRQ